MLHKHIQIQSRQRPCKCTDYGKAFTTCTFEVTLEINAMNVNTEGKPSLFPQAKLNMEKIDTGEQPLERKECQKGFTL